jgi:hypothetical protein
MSRAVGTSLMFDEESIRGTTELLPRLVRILFYAFGITNESYLVRYNRYFKDMFPEKSQKDLNQQATSHRKVLLESRRKLTFNMLRGVMFAMGYSIEEVSVRVRNQLTGEERVFSTDDTVESLKKQLDTEREVGVQSIM